MTKGKDAKKDAKKKPKGSTASTTSNTDTMNMLNKQPSKKKKEYK